MSFQLIFQSKKSQARLGRLKTGHGSLLTPFFMPIATRGVVKGISSTELENLKTKIILANTYHLMVKPGREFLKSIRGLHRFMNWSGPILTDSGGYQVFSLARHNTITNQGVKFKDPKSGTRRFLTPEESIRTQKAIGSDIMIAFDQCTPYSPKKSQVEKAVKHTISWAKRCLAQHKKNKNSQLLFAVGQGDRFLDLRLSCVEELRKMDFDGYCYGGMAPLKTVYTMLEKVLPAYPQNKPRYLMGVGYPDNIVQAVQRGVDMFDCVIPTREGRHGRVFLRDKKKKLGRPGFFQAINLQRAEFLFDKTPLDKNCACPACRNYTRSYLSYLLKIGDYLSPRLLSLHNIKFYLDLMKEIRKNIRAGEL
ncbi:MAG: tRNA guanosine(34) transglycosylase Tgt [Patescibacteria group bacterium]|nr:tRNA guanosine(34) transglycosylase Tgt [Patescibacteria group bacterium]